MTKNTNTKKKSSASKKLIPAIGMLTVSAMMLSTATYAWFTMNREVEVTGITMTASVPEDLQISLGDGMMAGTPALVGTVNATSKRLTHMTAPGSTDTDADWTNSVAISDYYTLGNLTPATSINGSTIYYTENANGVGKTLAGGATFSDATTSDKYSAEVVLKSGGTGTALSGKYVNGGAYYVDIPVWFRTSSASDVNLAVKATFTIGGTAAGTRIDGADHSVDIFKAARVAILPGEGTVATSPNGTSTNATATMGDASTALGIGVIYDGTADTTTVDDKTLQSAYYRTKTTDNPAKISGVGAYPAIADSGAAGTNAFTMNATGSADTVASWAAVDKLTEGTIDSSTGKYTALTGETVAVVTKANHASANYGAPIRYTIRVWLEGEDVNCWNATAGQDFNIDLKFYNQAAATNPNAAS